MGGGGEGGADGERGEGGRGKWAETVRTIGWTSNQPFAQFPSNETQTAPSLRFGAPWLVPRWLPVRSFGDARWSGMRGCCCGSAHSVVAGLLVRWCELVFPVR